MSLPRPANILVITSCTGEKSVTHPDALTTDDFRQGDAHVAERHVHLADLLTPARRLYTGQQHQRLLRGVRHAEESTQVDVDLRVLSAGYGLVSADTRLAPYECSFAGMKRGDLREHAAAVGVPDAIRDALAVRADLTLLLLGDDYLEACALDDDVRTAAPTIVLCGKRAASRLPALDGPYGPARVQILTNDEAKRFSCGLVALKGEVGARILEDNAGASAQGLEEWLARISAGDGLLDLLDRAGDAQASRGTATITENPAVNHIVQPSAEWLRQSDDRAIKYFIPDWDDRVDPDYDFVADEHASGRGHYSNEAYAHQLYTAPPGPAGQHTPQLNYDGLLVSRVIIDKSQFKREHIYANGVHKHLRVPETYPVLGDCGAFGYVDEPEPPFSANDLLGYYQDLRFTFGVSADHLILSPDADDRDFRYELTIENAADFIREHRAREYTWTPIGAVQGWHPESYADAARKLVAQGYDYLGLGGLVRSKTKDVLHVVEAVRRAVPTARLHLFGVARLGAIPYLLDMGLTSFDSASPLRRAWGNSYGNYWTLDGERYAAIRIPVTGRSHTAIKAVKAGRASRETLATHEAAALRAVRRCAEMKRPSEAGLTAALDAVEAYEALVSPSKASLRLEYERTLRDQPWKTCPCAVCQDPAVGVEVVLFRGNNRNRRRGFHNTYVFYEQLGRRLDGEPAGDGAAVHYEPELALA